MKLETLVTLLLLAALACNAAAAALFFRRRTRPGFLAMAAAFACCLGVFAVNWVSCGYPPFANMYHVMTVIGLAPLPLLALLTRRYRSLSWLQPWFALLALVPVMGTLCMERTLDWTRNPALQSVFFVPHVMSYVVSYALSGMAFLLGVARLIDKKSGRNYDFAIYNLVLLSVPFMTLGLALGAIWAEQAWGIYWAWDPKETFALVTWLIYLLYLHLKKQPHRAALANWVQMAGFASLLFTFLGVSLLPMLYQSLHSYAV